MYSGYCQICDHDYKQKSNLTTHCKTMRHKLNLENFKDSDPDFKIEEPKEFVIGDFHCEICQQNLSNAQHLKEHFNTARHKNKLESLKNPDLIVISNNTHCEVCVQDYSCKSKLTEHYKSQKHKSNLKDFNIKNNIPEIEVNNLFHCEACDINFKSSAF